MIEKSFFEYLGIANSERIHTQTLAWLFSENFDAISNDQRNSLLQEIFSLPFSCTIVKVITEYDNIDLYVETSNGLIILENKFKSSQHSNQLERYSTYINERTSNKSNFFFLTLVSEQPQNDEWKNISYQDIYRNLSNLNVVAGTISSIIFLEYLKPVVRFNFPLHASICLEVYG